MILVVGANGMLGQDLLKQLPGEVQGIDLPDIDITSFESIQAAIDRFRPRIVVNSAAYTDVDGCESNTELAMQVNGEGVAMLAMATRGVGAKLVQVSTDYVFDGAKGSPYLEDDPTGPLSVYGESKLAGELNARFNPDHLIVRTQWLYGLHGKNFVETMLKLAADKDELAVVTDQIGSPTWTADLAAAIRALIERDCRGTYHAANSGFCSWNDFAGAIFAESGISIRLNPLTTDKLNRPARRPLYSTLDCGKLAADTGFTPQPWQEALKQYLKQRKG
ncbi:spore coat polysaccharide biosynthesis protein SpsK [Geobacter sp. OR-1]|uniref:dTDP-4-dehydrorhamnose reductase n=1 Tax=Geobacter sp. OR-1 TaxID=1266765 RepID=UPI000541CAFB|nr:dTDP-4-dehydrorhamnose reductase [Geobacter sp. OR-1]GAM08445.1 spore coat polysaccharide biosynthesis protein SpsK [Geobacter sp. OR-1]